MSGKDLEALIEAVQSLPVGQVIRWNDMGVQDGMYRGPYIDVFADPVCHILEWGWGWVVMDPDVEWDDPPGVGDIVLPRDETHFEESDIEELEAREVAAWYPQSIDRALEAWVAEHAGRTDIRFEADPDMKTPMHVWIEEFKADEEAGLLDYVPAEAVFPELRTERDAGSGEGVDPEKRYEVKIERRLAEWLTGPPDPAMLEEMGWDDDEDEA